MNAVTQRQNDSLPHTAEIAHILFLDIEGYSRLPMIEQVQAVQELRECVRAAEEFARCAASGELLRIDTGDGMALAFFGSLHSPLICACEIVRGLGAPLRLPLRLGLHSGPVIRTTDINGRENVSGSGINLAKRVMDCGDAGHVLLSRAYADQLRPFHRWAGCLHDLGEIQVKHGQHLSLSSFQEGDVGLSSPPTRFHAPAPPSNLPFWHADQFIGRTQILGKVHRRLNDAVPVAIIGISGQGKTQLALHYAHLHQAEYAGGVFWINAADTRHLKDDYATLGRSFFGISEDLSSESCVARLRDIFAHLPYPALFIFDNVTADTDLQMLPTSPQARILLTSQQRYLVPAAFHILELPALETEAALNLLHGLKSDSRNGEEKPLTVTEQAAMHEIAEAVGRLPLALALIAHHRRRLHINFLEYRTRFLPPSGHPGVPEGRLLITLSRAREKFVAATGHKGNIYEAIERSYLSLSDLAREALSVGSVFASANFSRDLLLSMLQSGGETSLEEWEEALAELTDLSLVTVNEAGVDLPELGGEDAPLLRLHELVRVFTRMQLTEIAYSNLVGRLASALCARINKANEALDWRRVSPDLPHIPAILDECRALGLDESLYPLLKVQGQYLFEHRDYAKSVRTLREGLKIAEIRCGHLHRTTANILRFLARAEQLNDEQKSALRNARTALRIARHVYPADDPEMIEYYTVVGIVLKEQGRLGRARLFYERMWDLQTTLFGADHPAVAVSRNNYGMLCKDQGRLEEAEYHLREALAIEQRNSQPDDPTPSYALYLNNLGRVLEEQGKYADALAMHLLAREINQAIHGPHHSTVASCTYYAAIAAHSLGDWQASQDYYREALWLYGHLFGNADFRCDVVRKCLARLEEEQAGIPL